MPLPDQLDSAAAHGFRLIIDGREVPQVIEINGLKSEVDVIETKQQTKDGKFVVRQMIGRLKSGSITVTRGLTEDKLVVDWLKQVIQGDAGGVQKTAIVEVIGHTGLAVRTFEFKNAWVQSVEVSTLKSGATQSATEKFVLCFDESRVR
jgi:phage tail-like protein